MGSNVERKSYNEIMESARRHPYVTYPDFKNGEFDITKNECKLYCENPVNKAKANEMFKTISDDDNRLKFIEKLLDAGVSEETIVNFGKLTSSGMSTLFLATRSGASINLDAIVRDIVNSKDPATQATQVLHDFTGQINTAAFNGLFSYMATETNKKVNGNFKNYSKELETYYNATLDKAGFDINPGKAIGYYEATYAKIKASTNATGNTAASDLMKLFRKYTNTYIQTVPYNQNKNK